MAAAKTERTYREVGSSGSEWNFDHGVLEGTYKGSREVETDNLEGEGKRMSQIHDFESVDGDSVFIWGSWDLDAKLAELDTGAEVRIEFVGKEPIKGGKQTLKRYRVLVAE